MPASDQDITRAVFGFCTVAITVGMLLLKKRLGSESGKKRTIYFEALEAPLIFDETQHQLDNHATRRRSSMRKRKISSTSKRSRSASSKRSSSSKECRDSWHDILSNSVQAISKLITGDKEGRTKKRHRKKSALRAHPYEQARSEGSSSSFNHNKHRLYIANEILTSEQNYVKYLLKIDAVYFQPLVNLLTKRGMSALFSNFQDIVSVNRELLRQLEERLQAAEEPGKICLKKWNPVDGKLADIFLNLSPFLKMYAVYVRNFNSAIQFLAKEKQANEAFKAFLEKQELTLETPRMPLESYLIMPVQRIPRYRLLLTDLLRRTPFSHPDYEYLQEALGKIEFVANFVNEQIRQFENSLDILRIQNKLIGFSKRTLLEPGRRLVKQGKVTRICPKDHQTVTMFLFNDVLLTARPSKISATITRLTTRYRSISVASEPVVEGEESYYFSQYIPVSALRIIDLLEENCVEVPNSFIIRSPEHSFQVYCHSEADKIAWLGALSSAIDNFRLEYQTQVSMSRRSTFDSAIHEQDEHQSPRSPPGEARDAAMEEFCAPVWVPDEAASCCVICNEIFTLFKRRHHCRKCGGVVCGGCSTKKIVMPNGRHERACDSCYFELFRRDLLQRPLAEPESEFARSKLILDWSGAKIEDKSRRVSVLKENAEYRTASISEDATDALKNVLDKLANDNHLERPKAIPVDDARKKRSVTTFNAKSDVVRSCQVCLSAFGIFSKPYSCPKCFRVACTSCSSKTKNLDFVFGILEGDHDTKVRVCDLCCFGVKVSGNGSRIKIGTALQVKH